MLKKCKEFDGFKIMMKTRVKKVVQSGMTNDDDVDQPSQNVTSSDDVDDNMEEHAHDKEHSDVKVSVEILEDGKSQAPHDEEFDYLIMTPTAKEVLTMNFEPKLPYAKREAMNTLHYFGSVKVFLKFSKPFWAEENKLPIIHYNKTTINGNGGSAVSDDFLKVVGSLIDHFSQQISSSL